MKKLLFFFIPIISFGQPNKGKIDSVSLENGSLFQFVGLNKQFRGKFNGIQLDANGNLVLSSRQATLTNAFGNLVLGNSVTINRASNIAALCTDCDFTFGADYAAAGGDAHDIGGYSSTTFGYLNKNYIEAGTAIGSNITLGSILKPNQYLRSAGVGSLLDIQGTDVYYFGKGDGSTYNQPMTVLVYGPYKLGLLPDGRVLINGLSYRFPTTQAAGVLTNDGQGNLSWTNPQPIQQPTGFKIYDTQGRLLIYKPIYTK